MQVSPGTELVWSLANLEAVRTRKAEIEPDHFFCGVLQFIAIPDEGMNKVGAGAKTAALCAERDQTMKVFRDLSLTTRQLLPEMRRMLGGGSQQPGNQILHRSQASHDLFVLAVNKAQQSSASWSPGISSSAAGEAHGRHAAGHATAAARGGGMQKRSPRAPAATPMLDRYGITPSELAKKGESTLPPECAPQVLVLGLALQASDPSPLLLVCEQQVPVVPIVASASQGLRRVRSRCLQSTGTPFAGMLPTAPQFPPWFSRCCRRRHRRRRLCSSNAPRRPRAELEELLQALVSTADETPRILVAVSDQAYGAAAELDAELDGLFRVIWMHQLSGAALPDRV